MLLVRNLLVGPQRFTDLHEGLPGLSTGLLSARLKSLESAGVVTKTRLPPPAASVVYQLTSEGRRLGPAILSLAQWGQRRLGSPEGLHYDANSLAVGLWAHVDAASAPLRDGHVAVSIDAQPFDLRTADGRSVVTAGAPPNPQASIVVDSQTLAHIASGTVTLADALTDGRLTVDGAPEAIARLTNALAPGARADAESATATSDVNPRTRSKGSRE